MKIAELYRKAKPSMIGALSEIRFIPELVRYMGWSERSLLRSLPRGDGRPVLVIPGFLCSDLATWRMRKLLNKIGYQSFAWRQGINWGPRPGVRTRLLHRINRISQRYSQPVTLIGWSLGGVYARELSNIRPDLIREVITLGSPVQGKPDAIGIWPIYRWINRRNSQSMSSSILDYSRPILGSNLSIFTRGDGIVPWINCKPVRGHAGRSVEVRGSHIGLVHNPDVMTILAHHLASDTKLSESILLPPGGQQLTNLAMSEPVID